jgi:leucyl/phenylalanyl-tRNA--protein transferase
MPSLTPQHILQAYSLGVFPMAHADEGNKIYWHEPEMRGIIPLDGLKISKSLQQTIRSQKFHVTINKSFIEVMRKCAARKETWISEEIIQVFTELKELGYAFSFETRNEKQELVGGLYGVAMGKAFFGESMFHIETDASKVALVHLVDWLKTNHFILLDTQYVTEHLITLGAIEITQHDYLIRLHEALKDVL